MFCLLRKKKIAQLSRTYCGHIDKKLPLDRGAFKKRGKNRAEFKAQAQKLQRNHLCQNRGGTETFCPPPHFQMFPISDDVTSHQAGWQRREAHWSAASMQCRWAVKPESGGSFQHLVCLYVLPAMPPLVASPPQVMISGEISKQQKRARAIMHKAHLQAVIVFSLPDSFISMVCTLPSIIYIIG